MYCKRCGRLNTDNAKYCKSCGQILIHNNGERLKKRKSKKPMALAIILLIVAVSTGIALRCLLKKPDETSQTTLTAGNSSNVAHKYAYYKGGVYIADNGVETVVVHSNGSRFTADGILYSSQTSMDGTKATFISGSTLYYADGEEPQIITTDVYSYSLALSGNAVLYTTQMDGELGSLFVYTDGASVNIASNVFPNYSCISPDGETVIYSIANGEDGKLSNYIWSEGQSLQFDSDLLPVMITDKAQYVFYYRGGAFCVRGGSDAGEETRLGDSVSAIAFSGDCTQAVYHNNGEAYISINGGEGEKLSGSVDSFIMPGDTQTAVRYDSFQQPIFIYGVTGFADIFYLDGEQVYRINEEFSARRIVESAEEVELASDGRTIVFLSSGAISWVDGLVDDAKAEVWVDEDAEAVEIVAVFGENSCYFINFNSELCYSKVRGLSYVISDINAPYNNYVALYLNNKIAFISGETMYISTDGGNPTPITQINKDVISVTRSGIVVVTETNENQYVSSSGDVFLNMWTTSD